MKCYLAVAHLALPYTQPNQQTCARQKQASSKQLRKRGSNT
jgi:hypothetical protein